MQRLNSTEAGVKIVNGRPNWALEMKVAFIDWCANSEFQRSLISGWEPVSLSALRGARKWAGQYAKVRDMLFARCERLANRHGSELLDVYDVRARQGEVRRVWVLRRKGSTVGYRVDSL